MIDAHDLAGRRQTGKHAANQRHCEHNFNRAHAARLREACVVPDHAQLIARHGNQDKRLIERRLQIDRHRHGRIRLCNRAVVQQIISQQQDDVVHQNRNHDLVDAEHKFKHSRQQGNQTAEQRARRDHDNRLHPDGRGWDHLRDKRHAERSEIHLSLLADIKVTAPVADGKGQRQQDDRQRVAHRVFKAGPASERALGKRLRRQAPPPRTRPAPPARAKSFRPSF